MASTSREASTSQFMESEPTFNDDINEDMIDVASTETEHIEANDTPSIQQIENQVDRSSVENETETLKDSVNNSENKLANTDTMTDDAHKKDSKTKHATRLPLSRIKNIMKMDEDCTIISQDAVFLATKATEMFIEYVTKETSKYLTSSKRKTLMRRDVDNVIDSVPHLCFLDGVFE